MRCFLMHDQSNGPYHTCQLDRIRENTILVQKLNGKLEKLYRHIVLQKESSHIIEFKLQFHKILKTENLNKKQYESKKKVTRKLSKQIRKNKINLR